MRINPVTGEVELGTLGQLGVGIGFGMMAGYGPIYSFFGLILPMTSLCLVAFMTYGEWGTSIKIAWFITGILLSIRFLCSTRYNIIGRGFFWWIVWTLIVYCYRAATFSMVNAMNNVQQHLPTNVDLYIGSLFWIVVFVICWYKFRR